MRVLLLSSFDMLGGAARSTYRLHMSLIGQGVQSQLLVRQKIGVASAAMTVQERFGDVASIMTMMARNHNKTPLKLHPAYDRRTHWSVNWLPTGIASQVKQIKPDIVHLEWVGGGFVPIQSVARFNRPVIWTFHDSWAFTGGCHLPMDCDRYRSRCGYCPLLGSKRDYDASRWGWNQKHRHWQDVDLTVVTPSQWMAEQARSSSLFKDRDIQVIPNGIDLDVYKAINRDAARRLFNLPPDKKLIMFGAVFSTEDHNKGFHLLAPALRTLAENGWSDRAEVVVFGNRRAQAAPDVGLKVHYAGYLYDDLSLAALYSAADVFVIPSLIENLPNAVMEALACGIPCVGFRIGGLPELIESCQTGYLAEPYQTEDLARGIAWVLEDETRWQTLSKQARQKVEQNYEINTVARRYIDLYQRVLNRSI